MAAVDWVTTQQVKDQLEITGTGRDTVIGACISSASRALNRRAQRELTPLTSPATRNFRVPILSSREGVLVDLAPYDLRTVTTAKLHPELASPTTLVANTDYVRWPVGADPVTATYTEIKLASDLTLRSSFSDRFGFAQLEIVGAWGAWTTADVPEDVKRACIVTVGSWIDKAIGEYGDEFADGARGFQRSVFAGYAVPLSALGILQEAGLTRLTY